MSNLIIQQSGHYSADDFRRYFEARLPDFHFNGRRNISLRCPFHDDSSPSFSVNVDEGVWKCHTGCGQGGILAFEELHSRCDHETARKNVAELLGRPDLGTSNTSVEAVYTYRDECNHIYAQKTRRKDKSFYWTPPGLKDHPLYNLPEVIAARYVFICEGEKDCDNLAKITLENFFPTDPFARFAYTTAANGANGWKQEYSAYFKGKAVFILPDNDEQGRSYAQGAARSLKSIAANIKIVELPGLPEKGDVSDFIQQHGDEAAARLKEEITKAPIWKDQPQAPVWVDVDSFLDQKIESRRVLLEDSKTGTAVFRSSSLNQIFAFRGIGKSAVAHSLLGAMLHHEKFLHLSSASEGMKALLVDGELPKKELQERLDRFVGKTKSRLKLMTPELLPAGTKFPVLSRVEDQQEFISIIEPLEADLIVFDSLTSCFRFDTNDPETWDTVNDFLLDLRYRGYCVVLLHHAGKMGTQRGLSHGDDHLDISIKLSPPRNWSPGDGLRFEWTYEKVRAGGRLEGFAAKFDQMDQYWTLDDSAEQEAIELLRAGKSVRTVEKETGISKSKAQRLKTKFLM